MGQVEYKTDLRWLERLNEFDDNEQKILLALSNERYRWRTRERLAEVTGLDPNEVDNVLARLIRKEIIRPSFSAKKNVIFGLRERVG